MTDVEYRLKYPIGVEIRYMPNANSVKAEACKDIGKQGTVIKHLKNRSREVQIYLPTSSKMSKTWNTCWKNIKPIIKKNQQLLFSFMK